MKGLLNERRRKQDISGAVRFQFLPAVAMVLLGLLAHGIKNISAASAAFLLPILTLGCVDGIVFGFPFYSVIHNYHIHETAYF